MCPIVDPATKLAVARILTTKKVKISTEPFHSAVSLSVVNDSTVIRTYACKITTLESRITFKFLTIALSYIAKQISFSDGLALNRTTFPDFVNSEF